MTTTQTHLDGAPRGVISTDPFIYELPAERLRVGKQLSTPDGWQTIIGMLAVRDTDQVVVWTPERPDDDRAGLEGWKFHFGDPVQTRLEPTAEQHYQQSRLLRLERRRQRRLAMAAAGCPEWCIEHYTGAEGDSCHSSEPLSVDAADVYTGKQVELGLWMERRHRPAGDVETVGVLEVRTLTDDIELTPVNMRLLAAKLMSLADRAELRR